MASDPRLIRSWLFVPGDSERKIERGWSSGADAVILDLEDAVAPQNKDGARDTVRAAIDAAAGHRQKLGVFVRVNSLETGRTGDDIRLTVEARPDGYVVPKVEQASDLNTVARMLEDAGAPAETALLPIATETPKAVLRLEELCSSEPRTNAVVWGAEDLSSTIGARRVKWPDGSMLDVFSMVRSLTLMAGAAAGIAVVDAPFVEVRDLEKLHDESVEAAWMGFTGKLAIHPAQVPVINQAFMPDAEELDRARRIAEAADAGDGSVFTLDGRMIEAQHIRIARRMLALAEAYAEG